MGRRLRESRRTLSEASGPERPVSAVDKCGIHARASGNFKRSATSGVLNRLKFGADPTMVHLHDRRLAVPEDVGLKFGADPTMVHQ